MSRAAIGTIGLLGLALLMPKSTAALQADAASQLLGRSVDAAAETDFFRFFNLQSESQSMLVDGREHFLYRPPGDFQESVLLSLLAEDHIVVAASLIVHRSFIDHGVNGVFARDAVGSFVSAAPPQADFSEGYALGTLIKGGGGDMASAMLGETSPTSMALAVVSGRAQETSIEWEASTIRFTNDTDPDGIPSLSVTIIPLGGLESSTPTTSNTPESVVSAIFEAARTGDSSALAGLCDPAGSNDGQTSEVCEATVQSPQWADFVLVFERGSVSGAAEYSSEAEGSESVQLAHVPFVFGPSGENTETMTLILRGDRWYLRSF